jgi:hypothetical protein
MKKSIVYGKQDSHEAAGGIEMTSSLSRRRVIWLTAGAATALLRPKASASSEEKLAREQPRPLSWTDFIAQRSDLVELARARSAAGVDAYLYTVAALAVRLAAVPEAKLSPFKPRAPLVSFAPIHRGVPFFVIEWRMEPRAVLPPHNHPGHSVCTLALEGEARVRHYEPSADAPPLTSRDPFHLSLTREQVLLPRSVSTLGPERDNIHTFTAGPRGARGIDITTLHAATYDGSFSFLDISGKDNDSAELVARWTGM